MFVTHKEQFYFTVYLNHTQTHVTQRTNLARITKSLALKNPTLGFRHFTALQVLNHNT